MAIFKQTYITEREKQLPYYYWLSCTGVIGIKTYTKMQSYFASPRDLYMASAEKIRDTRIFTERQRHEIEASKKRFDVEKEYEKLLISGIRLIVREAEEFPEKLKEIPQSPIALYMYGTFPAPGIPLASVIGARDCSFYGSQVAARLGELFAEHGVCVVSGMARGIDSVSQEACIRAGGSSVAVLGGGVDVVYPKEKYELHELLKERGAVISEYPPGTNPQPQYFAQRNRIISGLSDVLCVIEAREKSGTMITVDAALEQGREVYVLPGRITDNTSRGCNELIKQGAGVITDLDSFVGEVSVNYGYTVRGGEMPGESETAESTDEAAGRTTTNKTPINIEETGFSDETDILINELTEQEKKIIVQVDIDSFVAEQMAPVAGITAGDFLISCLNMSMRKLFVNMGAGRFRLSESGVKVRQKLQNI